MTDFVPRPGQAVIGFWPERGRPILERLEPHQTLALGRREGGELPRSQHGDTVRITLPCADRYLSSDQLTVRLVNGIWKVRIRDQVTNPGSVRRWGDAGWRQAHDGDAVEPYRGLVALLLPGRSRTRMTLDAVPPALPAGDRATTEKEPRSVRLTLPAAQLDVVVRTFLDTLRWPPAPGPARVRGWTDPTEGTRTDAHRLTEARRRSYERLSEKATRTAGFAWTAAPGVRGADPTLLAELIDSGSLDYAQVYGREPAALIPTQHTHFPDGRLRSTRG